MNRRALALAGRIGAGVLGVALLCRHTFFGPDYDVPSNNLFLNAAIFMCVGLALLSDRLIDDPGMSAIARWGGYVGIAGISIATF